MWVVRLSVSAFAALLALSGCGKEIAGTGRPENKALDRTGGAPSSGGGNSSVPLLPPRSRSLDLTGVDPCKNVLTRDQLHELAYDVGYQSPPLSDKSSFHHGPTCGYSSLLPTDQPSRKIGALISISTSEGAEAWLTDPNRKSSARLARQAMIADFPALVLPNPTFVDDCAVVVDVHQGQYLMVSASPSGGVRGTSPDPYCAEAQRVVGMVLQNLLARR